MKQTLNIKLHDKDKYARISPLWPEQLKEHFNALGIPVVCNVGYTHNLNVLLLDIEVKKTVSNNLVYSQLQKFFDIKQTARVRASKDNSYLSFDRDDLYYYPITKVIIEIK